MKGNHRLDQVGDARAFAHPVDRGVDAVRARANPSHGVCQRQAVIVVAVQVDLAGQQSFTQRLHPLVENMRLHDAQGVGKADSVRASFDGGVADLNEKIEVGAGGILRRVADVQSQTAGVGDMFGDDADRLVVSLVQFRVEVNLRSGVEDRHALRAAGFGFVDARAGGDAVGDDLRPQPKRGDALDRRRHVVRDGRVTRFDHVHADAVEHLRDVDFLVHRKVDVGRLLAFSQCRIQNLNHDFSFSSIARAVAPKQSPDSLEIAIDGSSSSQ